MSTPCIPPPASDVALYVARTIRFRARRTSSGTWRAIQATAIQTLVPESRRLREGAR